MQEILLRIEEERRLQRQMQQDLKFKEEELNEKTAFQRVLREAEDQVINDERQKFESFRSALRGEINNIETAKQEAH